jgi:hypothetical protein
MHRPVEFLRKTLYLNALVWSVVGLALAALPQFVVATLFGQMRYPEYAWIRVVGIEAFALAMFMVLVAHRVAELWWWSWGFLIPTLGMCLIAVLNALFGLRPGSSPVLWWIFAGVTAGFSTALLYGIFRTGQERPIL